MDPAATHPAPSKLALTTWHSARHQTGPGRTEPTLGNRQVKLPRGRTLDTSNPAGSSGKLTVVGAGAGPVLSCIGSRQGAGWEGFMQREQLPACCQTRGRESGSGPGLKGLEQPLTCSRGVQVPCVASRDHGRGRQCTRSQASDQPLRKVPVGAVTPKSPSQPCSLAPCNPIGQPGELKMDWCPYLPGSCEDTDHGHPALASAQLLRFSVPPPPA